MKLAIYKSVYRLIGVGFILACLLTFLMMFGFFTEIAEALYSHKVHILQEFGCSLAFLGLISWWYSFNLDKGKAINLILTIFFVLLALVHWIDFFKGNLSITSPLINSIPMLVLTVMHVYYDFGTSEA